MHETGIAGHDDDEAVAVVLHPFEQGLDRLGPEILALVRRRERVCLVDEENAVERTPDRPVGLDRSHPDVLADKARPVDLDEVPTPEETHRAVHLREQPRHGRLARAGVAEEDEVLGGRDLG